LPLFNLEVPTALHDCDSNILDPRNTYESAEQWQSKAEDLASRFVNNFDKYTDTDRGASLVDAGPQVK